MYNINVANQSGDQGSCNRCVYTIIYGLHQRIHVAFPLLLEKRATRAYCSSSWKCSNIIACSWFVNCFTVFVSLTWRFDLVSPCDWYPTSLHRFTFTFSWILIPHWRKSSVDKYLAEIKFSVYHENHGCSFYIITIKTFSCTNFYVIKSKMGCTSCHK